MQGFSDAKPIVVENVNGRHQFRYNITEVPAVEDKVAGWRYDYLEVDQLDCKVIIDAMITQKYSYASQLGKLALSRTSAEWIEYNAYRLSCIDAVMSGLQ